MHIECPDDSEQEMEDRMRSRDIRKAFNAYSNQPGHADVPGSSLNTENAATPWLANAGMTQSKKTALGLEPRPYVPASSVQKCVRAGGKHNDLENVGHTARHHPY